MVEDIRFEILWYCEGRGKEELWPDEISEYLNLDICETIEAMEMLADAGQLEPLA